MNGILRKQPQGKSIWNEIRNSVCSRVVFVVGVMARLLGGMQRDDGLIF
jgi:hypothetical protein